MSVLEPLDPKLRELLALERGAYVDDSSARDAVLRRIQAAVVLAPLATLGAASVVASTGAAAAGGGVAKSAAAKAGLTAALGWKGAALVAVVALGGGIAVGEVHRASVDRSRASAVASTSVVPATTSTTSIAPPLPTTPHDLPSAELPAERAEAPPPRSSAKPARPATADPNEERALVDTARTALARGRASDALAATRQHQQRFPRGKLAEEREALAVQALVLAGDRAGALARATRFRRTYPSSIFGAAVDRAVTPLEGDALR